MVFSSYLSFDNFDHILFRLEAQSPRPLAWFIYNDSGKRFKPRKAKFPIIIVSSKPNDAWYYKRLAINQSHIFEQMPKKFYDAADYFLKLDDDVLIEPDYIERLIPFLRDGCYGAVSGRVVCWNGESWVDEKRASDYAVGNAMFFRKELLEFWDNNYPRYPASDTVLNITSNLLGFQTRQMDNIVFRQTRLTYVNSGYNRAVSMAVKRYYLRFPWFIRFSYLLKESSRRVVVKNFAQYFALVKDVKESERMDRPEIVRANNRRIVLLLLKKFRKPFSRWI